MNMLRKNKFKGKTIYIIGNGPSLNQIDMKSLRNEYTFCFNRANIAYEQWGFHPSFYMCIDKVVLPDNVDELNKLIDDKKAQKTVFFFPDWIKQQIPLRNNTIFFKEKISRDLNFCPEIDPLKVLVNVGATSIQIAVWLGFRKIVLLGCDCNYVEKPDNVKINKTATEKVGWTAYTSKTDQDPNHFMPNYFGKGKSYSIPNAASHLKGWEMVHEWITGNNYINEDIVTILNVSKESKITFFKKVSMDEVKKTTAEPFTDGNPKKTVVIYGASDTARNLIKRKGYSYTVKYFVDGDPDKVGNEIYGVPIKKPDVLKKERNIDMLIIAIQKDYETVIERLENSGFKGKIRHYSELL
jgi:hypothetical protein